MSECEMCEDHCKEIVELKEEVEILQERIEKLEKLIDEECATIKSSLDEMIKEI